MFALYRVDLKRELLSIRSLITIGLMVVVAIGVSRISSAVEGNAGAVGDTAVQLSSLFAVYALLAPFFVGLIFSGIFAYDMENQAIRYVIPYLSRTSIFVAKYLAIVTYFFVIVAVSLVIVAASGRRVTFDGLSLLVLLLSYMYCAALTCLASMSLGRQRVAMFITLLLGVCLPVVGMMAIVWSKNPIWYVVSYLLPYSYFTLAPWQCSILAVIVSALFGAGLVLFGRKDL